MKRYDAVVVGSGPNGLSAAVALARAGHSVKVIEGQSTLGGGARTLPLTLPGFQHDLCSAIHPMAMASPFFRELELEKHGVEFVHSPHALVHVLGANRVAILDRDVDATAARLGVDEQAWRRLMRPLVDHFEVLEHFMFNPITHLPLKFPVRAAQFGLKALQSAYWFAEENFEGDDAKALLAGCAAHSFSALTTPMTNAVALLLAVTGHAKGWPLVRGGSQKIIDALTALLLRNGGEIERGTPVESLAQLPDSKVVLFDTHAEVMDRVCADAQPAWFRALIRTFKRGPGVFKLDYALNGPMPWLDPACHRAATLHLGGPMRDVAESEARLTRGEPPQRPYVLVAQQSLFDASRAPEGQHTLWAYCHVPNASDLDCTVAIEAELERAAPGFQSRVLMKTAKRTTEMEQMNASYVGGDISGGLVEGAQVFLRPVPGFAFTTPNPRVLLCSSSAPPGPGVHGMCGYWAAQEALKKLRG